MAKNVEYDACVIGSDITGLCTAISLHNDGNKVLLLEEQDIIGGLYRPLQYLEQDYSSHLLFLPDHDDTISALTPLKNLIPELSYKTNELGPITFQNGQVQPFLGFAELNPEAIDLYSYFTQSKHLNLSLSSAQIVERLKATYQGEVLTQNKLTDIKFGTPTELTLNGSQIIKTKGVYYFLSPKRLSDLLLTNSHQVTKASTQKLGKSEMWTSVNLIYHHPIRLSDTTATHVLYGSKGIPCLGKWREEKGQIFSHWMTFINGELSADSEHIGLTVKEMKRQIKRMYNNFYDQTNREFIYVNSEAYGHVPADLVENGHIPKENQLFVGGRYFSQHEGFLGDLCSIRNWDLFNSKATPAEPIEPTFSI